MKSWKTTTVGILAIVAAASNAISATLDSDPATVPNWEIVVAAMLAGIGLIFAKDHSSAPSVPSE